MALQDKDRADVFALLSTYSSLLDEYERMGINTTLAIIALVGVLLTVISYIAPSIIDGNGQLKNIAFGRVILLILAVLVTIIINVYSYVYTYATRKAALYRGYCGYLEKIINSKRDRESDGLLLLHRIIMVSGTQEKSIYPYGIWFIAIIALFVELLCFTLSFILLSSSANYQSFFVIIGLIGYLIASIILQFNNYSALKKNWDISKCISETGTWNEDCNII